MGSVTTRGELTRRPPSLVIGLALHDGAGAIELFGQHEPGEFVWQCPWGEREPRARSLAHSRGKPEGSADDERHIVTPLALALQPCAELLRCLRRPAGIARDEMGRLGHDVRKPRTFPLANRSEEHTSELQSRQYPVCRLL